MPEINTPDLKRKFEVDASTQIRDLVKHREYFRILLAPLSRAGSIEEIALGEAGGVGSSIKSTLVWICLKALVLPYF